MRGKTRYDALTSDTYPWRLGVKVRHTYNWVVKFLRVLQISAVEQADCQCDGPHSIQDGVADHQIAGNGTGGEG